jgi:hypothetical protein
MTQEQLIILGLKIATIVVISGCAAWVIRYHVRTRGGVWHDSIGRSQVFRAIFAAGEAVPFALAAFFRFSTLGNQIGSWAFIGFLFLGGLAYWWLFVVFKRDDPDRPQE